jgi:ribosomal protein S1
VYALIDHIVEHYSSYSISTGYVLILIKLYRMQKEIKKLCRIFLVVVAISLSQRVSSFTLKKKKVSSGFTLKMGLLKVGVPKSWDDSKKDLEYIRKAGVRQFISTYNRVKDLKGDELLWGDEIEYGIFHIDPETKKVRLSLRAKEVSNSTNYNEFINQNQSLYNVFFFTQQFKY